MQDVLDLAHPRRADLIPDLIVAVLQGVLETASIKHVVRNRRHDLIRNMLGYLPVHFVTSFDRAAGLPSVLHAMQPGHVGE